MQNILQTNYNELVAERQREIDRGATSNQRIFPEWANARVILDADATELTYKLSTGSTETCVNALRHVRKVLAKLGERRLSPSMKLDTHNRPTIILVLKPR